MKEANTNDCLCRNSFLLVAYFRCYSFLCRGYESGSGAGGCGFLCWNNSKTRRVMKVTSFCTNLFENFVYLSQITMTKTICCLIERVMEAGKRHPSWRA